MLTRIIVGALIAPSVFVILFFLPPVCLAAMVCLITAVGSREMLKATNVPSDNYAMYLLTAVAAAAIPLGYWQGIGEQVFHASTLVLAVCLFFLSIRVYNKNESVDINHLMICLFAGLIIPSMLSSLIRLQQMEHGRYLVLLPVVSAFLTDVGAYFVGMFFGKHRGVTRVSPKKSMEGYIGGILCGSLFMLAYGLILQRFAGLTVNLPLMALYGLIGSAITELGDLSYSLIKRQYGVKDYGAVFPGHGGMYDRFDSMSFAAPTMLLLVWLARPF